MFTQQDVDITSKRAVEAYLEERVPLSQSIAKMAEDKELNPHQISRVIEQTNHLANHALRKSAEDKRFTFKLASVTDVNNFINPKGVDAAAYKKASALTDLGTHEKVAAALPTCTYAVGDAYNDPFACTKMFKSALRLIIARANKYAADTESASQYDAIQIESAKGKLAGILRPFVIDGELDKVASAIVHRYGSAAESLLGHVRDVVEPMSKRMNFQFKEAHEANLSVLRMPTGDEVVKNVPRINGNHPMIVELDTIKSKEYDRQNRRTHHNAHRTLSNAGVFALHDLNDNDTIHKYVTDQIMRFQDRYKNAPKIAIDVMSELCQGAAPGILELLSEDQMAKVSACVQGAKEAKLGFLDAVMDLVDESVELKTKIAEAFDKSAFDLDPAMLGLEEPKRKEGPGRFASSLAGGVMGMKALIKLLGGLGRDPRTGMQHTPMSTSLLSDKGLTPKGVGASAN